MACAADASRSAPTQGAAFSKIRPRRHRFSASSAAYSRSNSPGAWAKVRSNNPAVMRHASGLRSKKARPSSALITAPAAILSFCGAASPSTNPCGVVICSCWSADAVTAEAGAGSPAAAGTETGGWSSPATDAEEEPTRFRASG